MGGWQTPVPELGSQEQLGARSVAVVRVAISTRPFPGTKRSGHGMRGFRQQREIVVDLPESDAALGLKKRLAPSLRFPFAVVYREIAEMRSRSWRWFT